MKVRNFIIGAAAALMTLVSCQEEKVDLGAPKITLDKEEMTFEATGGEQTLEVTATREWIADKEAEWVVVSPESGEASADPQTVTVTVLPNEGMDREAEVTFTIGMASRTLTVKQAGPGGSESANIVYFNNFDKEKAVKSDNGWKTYLDSFEGWKNAEGTGSANCGFVADGMTARTTDSGHSAGKHSDYEGSGMNYLWFGTDGYFALTNITLDSSKQNYTLSFGSERNLYQAEDNTFNPEEFKVYISADGKKWVEIEYTFAKGVYPNYRWDLASSSFTLPAGTSTLNVYFKPTISSAYTLDDLKLVVTADAGTAIDFSTGVDMEIGDSTGGGDNVDYSNAEAKTVEQFIAAADESTYYKLTGKVSGFNSTYCSFDLTDDTGTIVVWSVENKSEWSDKIKNGGTVVVAGKYKLYNNTKHEVVDAYIISFTEGEAVDYSKSEAKTVEEFIAAADKETYFKLTGTASNFNSQYCSFDLTDDTGTIYVYSVANKSEWSGKIGNGSTVVLAGKYLYYESGSKHEVVDAYIISSEGGEIEEGGEEGGVVENPNEYEPEGITWTLGTNSYDAKPDSYGNAQTATVNGKEVRDLLKLGNSKDGGNATLNIPAGTKKIGFYAVAWNKKSPKLTVGAQTITPASNTGASGNPKYTITVADTDYYTVDVNAEEATTLEISTDNERVLVIGLKAITE